MAQILDFASIADIHAMKRRVHAHKGHGTIAVAGHDIKLWARRAIRDIEFFAQTQQLVAGAGIPSCGRAARSKPWRNWRKRLDRAERGGRSQQSLSLPASRRERLQMIGDQQTHILPDEPEELRRVAALSGFSDADAFADANRRRAGHG